MENKIKQYQTFLKSDFKTKLQFKNRYYKDSDFRKFVIDNYPGMVCALSSKANLNFKNSEVYYQLPLFPNPGTGIYYSTTGSNCDIVEVEGLNLDFCVLLKDVN